MKYYVGIDGGGSKTLAYLSDGEKMISSVRVGATNYHSMGIEKVESEIKQIFVQFKDDHGIMSEDIGSICFGGAGVDCDKDHETMTNVFRKIGYRNKLQVYNDSVIALVAANGEKRGAVIISGTGSIAVGIGKDGQLYRVGGWGHIIDDIGSGYFIGKQAIQGIMKYYDGRGPKTALWDVLKGDLELRTPEDLIPFVYGPKSTKQKIASIAKVVIDLSDSDQVSERIVNEAIEGLANMGITLIAKIGQYDIPLGLYGSILLKSDKIRNSLSEKIRNRYHEISIRTPNISAAEGALILAKEGDKK